MDYKRIASFVGVGAYVTATVIACGSTTTTSNATNNNENGNSSSTSSNGNQNGNSSTSQTTTTTTNNGGSTVNGATTTTPSTAGTSSTPAMSGNQGCGLPAETCAATVTAGAVTTQSCTYMNAKGNGPVFYFDDGSAGGTSTSCVTQNALCTQGTTNVVDSAYKHYGSGFGFQVNDSPSSADAGSPSLASGGLTWAASGTLPASFRVGISTFSGPCSGSAGCCYQVAAAATSGTIPWTSFTVDCYDATPDGGAFNPSADGLYEIKFQADSSATAGSYNYCITSLSF